MNNEFYCCLTHGNPIVGEARMLTIDLSAPNIFAYFRSLIVGFAAEVDHGDMTDIWLDIFGICTGHVNIGDFGYTEMLPNGTLRPIQPVMTIKAVRLWEESYIASVAPAVVVAYRAELAGRSSMFCAITNNYLEYKSIEEFCKKHHADYVDILVPNEFSTIEDTVVNTTSGFDPQMIHSCELPMVHNEGNVICNPFYQLYAKQKHSVSGSPVYVTRLFEIDSKWYNIPITVLLSVYSRCRDYKTENAPYRYLNFILGTNVQIPNGDDHMDRIMQATKLLRAARDVK